MFNPIKENFIINIFLTMMNINELKLGNYVYLKTTDGFCISEITLLSNDSFSLKTIDGFSYKGKHDGENINFIEPIELNEQLLLDNGFIINEKNKMNNIHLFEFDGINILKENNWNYTIFNNTSHADFYRDKIYIHDIQNEYYSLHKKELILFQNN